MVAYQTKIFQRAITQNQLLAVTTQFAQEEGTVLLLSGGNFFGSKKSFLALFPIASVEGSWDSLATMSSTGYWFGYIPYEMGVESLADSAKGCFYQHAFVAEVDHTTDSVTLSYSLRSIPEVFHWLLDPAQWPASLPIGDLQGMQSHCIKPLISFKEYEQQIALAKEWILDGEVYQVNLSHEMIIQSDANPFNLFRILFERNPVPFSAYLQLRERTILSLSPERFIKGDANSIETWPIKGTSPRGLNAQEDSSSLEKLLNSEKEKAELMMIIDLMRHDLGKISKPGSVEVPLLRGYEGYANVFHTFSIIRGSPLLNLSPLEQIKACFPAGSITGCPKIRAMELINRLEKRTRGVYTGCIGYIKDATVFDFNVAIRTLNIKKNNISIQLGGAITIDSVSEDEYFETLQKGATFLDLFCK